MKKLVYVLLTVALFSVFGCSGDDSTSTSITAPNPNPFQPKGTVTGVLTDRITNQPIANASVLILDRSAITNSAGIFTITNIPANTPVGNEPADASGRNTYNVVIDLTAVNSAIDADAANTTKEKYPTFAYSTVQVKYDSLGDTTSAAANTNVSNHDTPVDGFVASMAPSVGKLAANLRIQVVDIKDQVVTGATVQLFATGGAVNAANPVANVGTADAEINTSTGNLNHLISSATTDADGLVTFSNVEAGAVFRTVASIAKSNAPGSNGLVGIGLVVAAADKVTRSYLNQQDRFNISAGTTAPDGINDAIKLASVDLVKPIIIETTPATLSDIAANTTTVVKFKFSEPLLANNYANATTEATAQNGGLWNDVYVNFDGPKAGNLPYTLSWDTNYTELSVTFATVAASKYTVSIQAAAFGAGNLVDADNSATVADANGNGTVTFTTSGGNLVSAPTLVRTNDTTINWAPITNAYKYRVYVSRYVNGVFDAFGYADTTDTRYVLGQAGGSAAAVFIGFASEQVPATYKVKVIAMGTANVESAGAASAETTMNDTILPRMTASTATFNAPAALVAGETTRSRDSSFTVNFNEAMSRDSIQTVAKWSILKAVAANAGGAYTDAVAPATDMALPVVKSVVYNAATNSATVTVTVTRTANTDVIDADFLLVKFTGTDVNGNAINSLFNEFDNAGGVQ